MRMGDHGEDQGSSMDRNKLWDSPFQVIWGGGTLGRSRKTKRILPSKKGCNSLGRSLPN